MIRIKFKEYAQGGYAKDEQESAQIPKERRCTITIYLYY